MLGKCFKIFLLSFIFVNTSFSWIQQSPNYNAYNFNEYSRSTTINSDPNKMLEINLEGNPSTGYQWYLVNYSEIDFTLLEPIGVKMEKEEIYSTSHYFASNNMDLEPDQQIVGNGGIFLFKFKPKGVDFRGVELKFKYMRIWEDKNSFPEFTLSVNMTSQLSTNNINNIEKNLKVYKADNQLQLESKIIYAGKIILLLAFLLLI